MINKRKFSIGALFLLLFLTIPQFLFTYIFLWVTSNRVIAISELNFKEHAQVFLPATIFVANQTYLFFKKDSLANSEKLFEYVWSFSKMFMGFAGLIMSLTVIGSIFKPLSDFFGNLIKDFLPTFYAELLYVAFVILPVLIAKSPVPKKNNPE